MISPRSLVLASLLFFLPTTQALDLTTLSNWLQRPILTPDIPLAEIQTCEIEGDALVLDAGKGELILFVDWLPLSLLSGGRRTKNWLRAITRAKAELAETPA